jgi:hypothetical protein
MCDAVHYQYSEQHHIMYRVTFKGAKRLRDSIGHESRDEALLFLAKNAASIVSDVKITSDEGAVEHLQASKDPAYYEDRTSVASVAPVQPRRAEAVLPELQVKVVRRLLESSSMDAIDTLRAVAARYGVAGRNEEASVLRQRMAEAAGLTTA